MPSALELSVQRLPEAAVQVDARGRVVARNDLATAMFSPGGPLGGADPTQALTGVRGFREWLAGAGDDFFHGRVAGQRENGVPLTVELRARRLDAGEEGALCILAELDRARVSSEARRFFDIAFDTAPIGMALFNTDGEYVRVNAALCDLLGRRADELLGRRDQEFTHPDDRQSDVDAAWQILRGEINTWQCEKRFLRSDGSVVWTIANLTFLRDAEGNPLSWVGQFQDITERKALEASLRERERQTREILETAHDAFISIDVQGHITEWNPQAQAVFGWARDEVLGRCLGDTVLPERDRAEFRSRLERYVQTRDGLVLGRLTEMTAMHRSGREFPVELTAWAVERGDEHALNAFVRDISDRRQTEEELALAHAAAVEGSRMKSEFLANMSHEIRTPLNGVIGMSGLLLTTELEDDQREYAETVRRSGETLLEIVNDILDFSKIEAGKLELERSEFDLCVLAEDVAELVAAEAQRKQLELTTMVEPDVPAAVSGDPGRIRQVLTNLVGNAIKFTDAGELSVRVSRVTAGDPSLVRIAVRDTGPGIDPDDRARLFDPFTQADASTTRRFGGTGLGLAISRRLTEIMGGSIGVESTPGEGSTFWFTVPLTPVAAPDGGPTERVPLGPARALVVDDSPTSCTILERQLTTWGMVTSVAADGEAALRLLRKASQDGRPIDVALVDSNLPAVDGLEVAAAIGPDLVVGGTKLIMLTPVGVPRPASSNGAVAYVAKPVRQSQLFDAMANALGMRSAPAGDRRAERELPDLPESLAGLRVLVVDDNAVNQRVMAAMLGRLGFRVDVAGDGSEAVGAVDQAPYAAVLMDCQMPVKNGYQATAEIRTREDERSRIPIVALTASALKGDEERCLAAGMDAYLAKPVRMEALAEVLTRLLAG